jgi:hypothetical protein
MLLGFRSDSLWIASGCSKFEAELQSNYEGRFATMQIQGFLTASAIGDASRALHLGIWRHTAVTTLQPTFGNRSKLSIRIGSVTQIPLETNRRYCQGYQEVNILFLRKSRVDPLITSGLRTIPWESSLFGSKFLRISLKHYRKAKMLGIKAANPLYQWYSKFLVRIPIPIPIERS